MPDKSQPSLPQTPSPSPPVSGNVASLTSPSTISSLDQTKPQTFGDQAKDQAKQYAKQQVTQAAVQSTIVKLNKEKANLILEGIKLDIQHQRALSIIDSKHKPHKQIQKDGSIKDLPPEYDDEEYQKAKYNENQNYQEAQKNLQDRKDKNQKDLDDYYKDPFKKQKDEYKKLKEKLKKRKNKVKGARKKALKKAAKQIWNNNKAAIGAILAVILTNKLADIIANNGEIGKLVDDTNAIITEANESGDETKLKNAQIARDNALRVIQENEDRINQIQNQIQTISVFILIFGIVVDILSAIPLPVAVPPGVGIPMNVITLIGKLIEYANKLVLVLSALLPIIEAALEQAIDILEDYKTQLLDINGQLENSASNGNSSLFGGIKVGPLDIMYKGFKFAIREEKEPGSIVVRGNKRHYAVAIDKNNVEVLKSEYSFTLDPDDLVSQLKLIIDRENLIP